MSGFSVVLTHDTRDVVGPTWSSISHGYFLSSNLAVEPKRRVNNMVPPPTASQLCCMDGSMTTHVTDQQWLVEISARGG